MASIKLHLVIALSSVVLLIMLVHSDSSFRAIFLISQKTFAQEEIQPPTLNYNDFTDSYGYIHQHHHHRAHHWNNGPMDEEINPTNVPEQNQW